MSKKWKASEGYAILEVDDGKVFVYHTNNVWYADTPKNDLCNIKFDSMKKAIDASNYVLGIDADYDEEELNNEMYDYHRKEISHQLSRIENYYWSLSYSLKRILGSVDSENKQFVRDMIDSTHEKYKEARSDREFFNRTFYPEEIGN